MFSKMNILEVRRKLAPPEDFHFPYTPYPMQEALMRSLYEVLEENGIGIFESPTGTGKSLTLTCAALHWLEDHEKWIQDELKRRIHEIDVEVKELEIQEGLSIDWINVQYATNVKRDELRELLKFREYLNERENHLAALRARCKQQKKRKKNLYMNENMNKNKVAIALDLTTAESDKDESSDDEGNTYSVENELKEKNTYPDVKIFFCSRTHTQLTQVLREVKRTVYGSRIRCVTLASRQQLCIHPLVKKLGSVSTINEQCLKMARNKNKSLASIDMKQQKKQQVQRCAFKTQTLVDDLMATVITNVIDIEELVNEAGHQQACPYYAARAAAANAQLVFLSYQMLLHKHTREQCGIDLRNSIIIIDEGQNLLDTIAEMNSCKCTLLQMRSSIAQIKAYKKKHLARFSAANLLKINQLLYIIHRLETNFHLTSSNEHGTRLYETYQLMSETDICDVDIFALLEFCKNRHLAQKIQYTQSDHVEYPMNTLHAVLAFLESLTENAKDGRVVMSIENEEKSYYKYISLNPARHFEEVVNNARAVIVAGGTLQPTMELKTQLFANNQLRIREYFYDHVVPSHAVKCFVLTQDSNGTKLHFNFKNRMESKLVIELCSILSQLCTVIPAGVVVFFPSYEFLDATYAAFSTSKHFELLLKHKHVLKEEKNSKQTTENLLIQYKMHVQNLKGALLMAVVGGKLSEGLDFKDALGRGVIVVGMPYPNRNSPELKERMQYLDKQLGAKTGEIYYENLCLKSVNQCIGRAIRHIDDYACVYLLDMRYSQLHIQNKLPQWIRRSIQITESIDVVVKNTTKFFSNKNEE